MFEQKRATESPISHLATTSHATQPIEFGVGSAGGFVGFVENVVPGTRVSEEERCLFVLSDTHCERQEV